MDQRRPTSLAPRQVLIIDDDEFMQDLLHEMLDGLGLIHIEKASDGARALEFIRAKTTDEPDILICDLAMPTMDGIEFLRNLATLDFSGGIILLSGTSQRILYAAEQLGRAHGLRMLGILEKPVSLSAMRQALAQFSVPGRTQATQVPQIGLTESEIREGIERGCVTVFFQPKISLTSRQVVGVECLARWQDPMRGTLSPAAFIDVAEQAGLISRITECVFRQAARWASEWNQRGHPIKTSINLSMNDLARLDLPEQLTAWAEEAGISNDYLVLELTESRLMGDQKVNLDIITRLRLKEFGLSIDDFGTGYSTLDKLKSLPFTELKIDRAFVTGAAHDQAAQAILESSVHLGRALGLTLVAEGVETQEDWDVMAKLGIDEVQGYFIARPMAASELLDWKLAWEKKRTIDFNRLREIVGSDPTVQARVLEKFLATARHYLDELAAARKQGHPEALGILGHKLKTGARSMGAQALADACQRLENAGNASDRAECDHQAEEIARHFAPVAAHIEAQLRGQSE